MLKELNNGVLKNISTPHIVAPKTPLTLSQIVLFVSNLCSIPKGLRKKSVAKLKCLHLVHTDCLKAAARALNSDGRRYGFHRFIGPTAGCPICEMPASLWETHFTASSFPIFWMHRIQACLEKIGPAGGLIQIDRVRLMLWDDKSLTKEQKECLRLLPENPGFFEAFDKGQNVFVAEHMNGGARNGGTTTYRQRPGCWDWEMRGGTLWMQKWGPTPIPTRATMIESYEIATVTEEKIRANIPIFPTRRSWTLDHDGVAPSFYRRQFVRPHVVHYCNDAKYKEDNRKCGRAVAENDEDGCLGNKTAKQGPNLNLS